MVPDRITEVAARLRHLLSNLQQDGHLNIARYVEELVEWIEREQA